METGSIFKGSALVLVRTVPGSEGHDCHYDENVFRGRQRKLEVQVISV